MLRKTPGGAEGDRRAEARHYKGMSQTKVMTIKERKESMATGKALDGKTHAGNPHVRFDAGEVAPAATPRRGSLFCRTILCLILGFAAVTVFGAYQYIISTDPTLAVNPSESAYSTAVSVNVRASAPQTLGTALETRYRTSAESGTSALNRQPAVLTIIIR